MTIDQHSKFNQLLNKELLKTKASDYKGTVINYEHLYEKDVFYNEKNGNKVRVTINTKTNEIVENGIITKVKLDQLDIFSPQTRMDFRVSINEEKKVSKPTTSPEHEREKDRLSYRHELFRIDLTQVKSQNSHSQDRGQGWEKAKVSHELEVEIIDLKPIFEEYKLHLKGLPNQYYSILQIFLTNIRLLARSSNKF
ncbi:mRNA triphosphatase CET1 [Neoconidiobolus thromboides FSU 785]|nr:mRNA triphosphatase CET1 [Neoconidiobolus thromboides FSU 785]